MSASNPAKPLNLSLVEAAASRDALSICVCVKMPEKLFSEPLIEERMFFSTDWPNSFTLLAASDNPFCKLMGFAVTIADILPR